MSTIPLARVVKAAKGALVTGIGALTAYATAEIPVTWGHPMGKLEDVCAWVGDFRSQQQWATQGDHQRETSPGTFDFSIWVVTAGATASDVEQAALDLLDPVEAWLRANVTAGIDLATLPGCKHLRLAVETVDLLGGAGDQARAALINADISLIARI